MKSQNLRQNKNGAVCGHLSRPDIHIVNPATLMSYYIAEKRGRPFGVEPKHTLIP